MLSLKFNPNNLSTNQLRLLIALTGVIVCLLTLIPDRVIARDGSLYIQTAEIFITQGFSAAYSSFNWPFYSILIGALQLITPFSYETSAHIINIGLYLLLVDAFVRFYWHWQPSAHYKWLPGVVLLAYTGINDYQPETFRDWGFWAFSWLSFCCFIKAYQQEESIIDFLGWQAAIIAAFLFRSEAIAFMGLMPFMFLVFKRSPILFLKSISLFISLLIIAALGVVIFGLDNWSNWGRIGSILVYLNPFSLIEEFINSSLNIAQFAVPYHYESHAISFVFSGLLGVLTVKTLLKLGYFYLPILIYGVYKKLPKPKANKLPLTLLFISFSVVFVFFCNSKVIAGRYVIQTTLVLLLFVCYYADIIIQQLLKKNFLVFSTLITVLFVSSLLIGIIHSSSSKLHIREMGTWVKNNVDDNARIISNSTRLYYYSGRRVNSTLATNISFDEYKDYDYLLLYIKTDPNALAPNQTVKVHSISNKKGSSSSILYKITK